MNISLCIVIAAWLNAFDISWCWNKHVCRGAIDIPTVFKISNYLESRVSGDTLYPFMVKLIFKIGIIVDFVVYYG